MIEQSRSLFDDLTQSPINWISWDSQTLDKAKAANKPVYLLIGSKSAYWSHKMSEETLQDERVAALINEYFTPIAVEREEHPDLELIFSNAVQAMTGKGGYPISVFLTPELKPFFGGSYFPLQNYQNMPSFTSVIANIAELWQNKAEEVKQSADQVFEKLKTTLMPVEEVATELKQDLENEDEFEFDPDENPLMSLFHSTYKRLEATYDKENGGFGSKPKFLLPANLRYLMRYFVATDFTKSLELAVDTANAWLQRPVFDFIEGGFFRCSYDEGWYRPDFEKMACDNAHSTLALLELFQITESPALEDSVVKTLEYLQTRLLCPFGGFYVGESSFSRDEDGKESEGYYYTWSADELVRIIGRDQATLLMDYFQIDNGTEVNDRYTLSAPDIEEFCEQAPIDAEAMTKLLAEINASLKEERLSRRAPRVDERQVASDNGLMISVFAKAYQVFEEPTYLETARQTAEFVCSRLLADDLHSIVNQKDGTKSLLDDYAFVINGLIDLYETDFDMQWLHRALDLTNFMIKEFYIENEESFVYSRNITSVYNFHLCSFFDSNRPSATSEAVLALLRLSVLTDNQSYRAIAEKTTDHLFATAKKAPSVSINLTNTLFYTHPEPLEIAVSGSLENDKTKALLRSIYYNFCPNKVLVLAKEDSNEENRAKFPLLKHDKLVEESPAIYICYQNYCDQPITEPEAMEYILCSYSDFS